jgi:hypothetical protein
MIQDADADEVIALVVGENGHPRKTPSKSSKYGFKGWTIEEILTDVRGLPETKSQIYNDILLEFYSGIESNDKDKVSSCLDELKILLNPRNELLKVLSIQASAIGVVND